VTRMTKTKLCANDKIRAALARRVPPSAAEVFKPKPPKKPEPELNKFEIAGRARRAAQRERLHRAKVAVERLIVQFPECFKPPDQPPWPLKIGIDRDVLAALPDVSRSDLKRALGCYVRAKAYREALIEGAMRVDLDGNPTAFVTAAEAWPRAAP
jgi:hypothetical protein